MYAVNLGDVRLPITPSKINTRINNKNRTLDLLGVGEVNILKPAGLTEFSFTCLIPKFKYPFSVYPFGFREQIYFLDYFEKLKKEKLTFQFIISRVAQGGQLMFDTNVKCSLEEYELVDDAEQGFDLTVNIKLKQYRDYNLQKIVVKEDTTGKTDSIAVVETQRTTPKVPINETHRVKKGDTLWAIAKLNYGDASKYKVIAKKNNIKNPNLIYPGQVLKL